MANKARYAVISKQSDWVKDYYTTRKLADNAVANLKASAVPHIELLSEAHLATNVCLYWDLNADGTYSKTDLS